MALQGGYRLLSLSLVVLGVWIAAWATGVTAHITPESMRSVIAGRGLWGVVAFTFIFSAGQLLRVTSFVFVATAVAVYGRNSGMLVALFGAIVSATVSFVVVRAFAGQALADVERPFIRRLLTNIDRRPVLTVALLRLIFQTAPPLNYALPMTAVRWSDHLVGSALGLPVPVTVMACLADWLLHRSG
jgi:uncharacterized membrane protein YdjX (TVP38/TMEM64 family)